MRPTLELIKAVGYPALPSLLPVFLFSRIGRTPAAGLNGPRLTVSWTRTLMLQASDYLVSRRFRHFHLFVIRPAGTGGPQTISWKVNGTGTVIRVKFTEWYCSQIANLMIIFNRRVRVLLNSNTLPPYCPVPAGIARPLQAYGSARTIKVPHTA